MIQKTQMGQVDVIQLLLIIWRKRFLVAFFTLISCLAGAFYYFSTSNIYSAKISIQVGIEESNPLSFSGLGGITIQSNDDYGTQVELIQSRKLLITVVDQLDLKMNDLKNEPVPLLKKFNEDSYFHYFNSYLLYINKYISFFSNYLQGQNSRSSELDERIEVAQRLQKMLTISHQKGSEFIIVTARSYSPILATKIVNTLADIYIDYHQQERKNSNEGTSAWLLNELEIVKIDIVEAEKELRVFSESEDLVDIEGVMSLKADELKELAKQKTTFEQIVDDRRNQYEAMIGVTAPVVLLNSDTIKANPIIELSQHEVSTAQEALLEASLKYGVKHPAYIFAEKNLEITKAQLDTQLLSLIKAEKVKLLSEQKKLAKVESLFINAKEEFQRLSKLEGRFLQKKREVIAHQELYEAILKKLQETQTISGLEQQLATVFDYALVQDTVNTSKRMIGLIISVAAGFLLGVVLALLKGLFDQKIWNVNELARFVNKPVLGSLPKMKNLFWQKSLKSFDSFTTDIVYIESIHALRARFLSIKKPTKIIAIMSAMPEEGKSTICLNLSQSFSELEKVLVIDADLRKPSLTNMLNFPDDHPGLSDILSKTAQISDCIIQNQQNDFDVLTAGNSLENSNSLISSIYMPKLLEELSLYYDKIIIETAPVYLFSDAEVMSRLMDGVLFVVKSEKTLIKDVKQAIEKLDNVGANVLGTILNQTRSSIRKQNYTKYIKS